MSNSQPKSKALIFQGFLNAANVPGFALFGTMLGFSVLAKEAGFDFWMAIFTTITVWGLPGQVAFASFYATSSSLLLIFIAVSLANMRMMLMVISGAKILDLENHSLSFWKQVLLMHLMAITSWAQIGYVQSDFSPPSLLKYYIGFATTIFVFGISGTALGFYLDEMMPPELVRIIIFMTPLYILLLVINAKQTINRLSVVIGGVLSPLFYPFVGSWCILYAGIIGGVAGLLIIKLTQREK